MFSIFSASAEQQIGVVVEVGVKGAGVVEILFDSYLFLETLVVLGAILHLAGVEAERIEVVSVELLELAGLGQLPRLARLEAEEHLAAVHTERYLASFTG